MRHGCWVGALLLVALLVSLAWLLQPEGATAVEPAPVVPLELEAETEPVLVDLHVDAAPAGEVLVEPAPPTPATTADVRTVELVLVRVLDANDRKPLSEAVVSLQSPKLANPIVFECDEQGELEFEPSELEAAFGDRIGVVVEDGEHRARLRTSVELQPELVLLVPSSIVLGGEVVLPGLLSPDALNVSIWTKQAESGDRFVGNQVLDDSGRFAIQVSPVQVPDSFLVRVERAGIPCSVRVPTRELTAPEGARIEVALSRLAVTVLDDVDAPVERALVRVSLTTAEAGVTSRFADTSTGEDGIGHVWVPAGPVGVVASAPHHTAQSEDAQLASGESQVTIRLRRLTAADTLVGRVELDDGSPVRDAYVTVGYALDDGPLAYASKQQQQSNVEGGFEMAIATDRALLVTANHKILGASEVVTWQPGSGPVRLVYRHKGSVSVNGTFPRTAVPAGDIELNLEGPRDMRALVSSDALPVTISHLEPGSWRVFSVAAGSAWAEGQVLVESNKTKPVTLVYQPMGYITGRLRRLEGRKSVTVEFAPTGWPLEATKWSAARALSEDGTFRLPTPRDSGELRVRVRGEIVERWPAQVGTPLDITLPE